MAKKNLLLLVQEILTETDGDEVNSITDTEESFSLAQTIKLVFEELYSQRTVPEHFELGQLDALGDVTKPTHMQIPDGVKRVVWLKYNFETTTLPDMSFRNIQYLDPTSFIDNALALKESADDIFKVTDPSGVEYLIRTDRFPSFWTSFDDYHIVFDAYQSDEEATMQASRTLAWFNRLPSFTLDDSHIIDLDQEAFPILYNEAKGRYVFNRRQMNDPFANRDAKRARVAFQHNKSRIGERTNVQPRSYGRRPSKF